MIARKPAIRWSRMFKHPRYLFKNQNIFLLESSFATHILRHHVTLYIYIHIYIYINHIIHTLYIIHFSFHTSQIAWRLPACVQVFLDRLSRVISSVETRASQYLDIEENEVANLGASWSILRNGFFKCQRPSRKSRYEMVSNVHLVLFLQGFYFESDPILMATCFTAVY